MFTRIQHIRSVIGNNNIFINGDVVADEEVLTKIAGQLLRRELDILTQEARERLLTAVDEFVNAVINKIEKANLSSKLEEFSHPSTQFALYAALKGYATSETDTKDALRSWSDAIASPNDKGPFRIFYESVFRKSYSFGRTDVQCGCSGY